MNVSSLGDGRFPWCGSNVQRSSANIFGWPVSGITYPAEIVTVIKTTQNGPDFITGSNFGPEGGLLGTFIFILGIIIIFIWLRLKNGISVFSFHSGLEKYSTGNEHHSQ